MANPPPHLNDDRAGPPDPLQLEPLQRTQATYLRLVLDAANLGTWYYDVNAGNLYMDERCRDLFGMTSEGPYTPRDVLHRIHPEDREQVIQAVRHALAAEATALFIYEYHVVPAEGAVRWIQGRGQVYFEGDEKERRPVYVAGVVMDVTRRRNYEAELKKLNERLEERVREQVEQVRRLARALTLSEQRERQRIAQVLHNDLQQILYGFQITLSLLQTATSAGEKSALLKQAREMLDQALNTTSTLTEELSPPVLTEDDLAPILTWLAAQYNEQYGLTVDVDLQDPCQIADPDVRILIYQFLRELLFNIVKHAKVDHAQLVAWEKQGIVQIRVKDGGVGFDPAVLERTPRRSDGFNLVSMRERLQLLGGQFRIESAPGQGVRILLTVPAHE